MGKGSRKKKQKISNRRTQAIETPANKPEKPKPLAPTPEQQGRGVYVFTKGPGIRSEHVTNLASDMIGRLHCDGQITTAQEQAARHFQRVWHDYRASLPLKGYRSCLDISAGGYDGSEGDPRAEREWADLKRRVGGIVTAVLVSEIDKPTEAKPHIIGQLRFALDKVAEGC